MSADREKHRAWEAAYRLRNPGKARTRSAAWRLENAEKVRAYQADYRRANPGKRCAASNRHRARKADQLCECCTRAEVEIIYTLCPPGHEVDHRTPLALGGKHCRHNLQYLTEADHARKTNQEDIGNISAYRGAMKALGLSP